MKIAIVSGSHRVTSESIRIGRFIESQLRALGADPTLISLAGNPLPLWDEGVMDDDPKWKALWTPFATKLQDSQGLVIISPEWAGMVPPGLKNFLLLCSNKEVAHKPALIVTVSSGIGGSYPVAELRASSYKNNRIVYIPDHVIVRSAPQMLLGDAPTNERDAALRKRIHYSLEMLLEYSKALTAVRESALVNYKEYPFGM
jgi:NAD(P)H-dependent FMN reductase